MARFDVMNYNTISLDKWLTNCSKVLVVGVGGGGDAISSFPTIRFIQNAGKEVVFANIHISSDPVTFVNYSQLSIGKSGFKMYSQPKGEKTARCIELLLNSSFQIPIYTCLSNYGAAELANSLRLIIEANNINAIFAVDGGTDTFAGIDTNITSIINDAISLAALSMLNFKNFPLGIIGCCADLEMDLNKFMEKFSLALSNNSYMGVIDFPVILKDDYFSLLSNAKRSYPFFVCETVYKASQGTNGTYINCYNQNIPIFPFQMFTFVFNSNFIIESLNPFVKIVESCLTFDESRLQLLNYLNKTNPTINWDDRLHD